MKAPNDKRDATREKTCSLASVPVTQLVHELRTPLGAVMGYCQFALEMAEARQETDIANEIKTSLRAAQHLSRLVSDMLDLSRIESGNVELSLQDIKLRDLFCEISVVMDPQIEANDNRLVFVGQDDDTRLVSDSLRLTQILVNLVSNANNHTKGGVITVRHEFGESGGVTGDVFSVSDTGCGMRPAKLATIFEPFEQDVDARVRSNPGSGLGLTITRALCDLLGGNITVTSIHGEGSTFTVVLPSAQLVPDSD